MMPPPEQGELIRAAHTSRSVFVRYPGRRTLHVDRLMVMMALAVVVPIDELVRVLEGERDQF